MSTMSHFIAQIMHIWNKIFEIMSYCKSRSVAISSDEWSQMCHNRAEEPLHCTRKHNTWCKACLYGMTESLKSPHQADVWFVSHHDTLHVNSNSNLDFSTDEHFRLDLCKHCELRRVPCRDDAFGSARLSAREASMWSMHIRASWCGKVNWRKIYHFMLRILTILSELCFRFAFCLWK